MASVAGPVPLPAAHHADWPCASCWMGRSPAWRRHAIAPARGLASAGIPGRLGARRRRGAAGVAHRVLCCGGARPGTGAPGRFGCIGRSGQSGVMTPALVLTAREGVPDRICGLDAGANDDVVKPVDLHELAGPPAGTGAPLARPTGRAPVGPRHRARSRGTPGRTRRGSGGTRKPRLRLVARADAQRGSCFVSRTTCRWSLAT